MKTNRQIGKQACFFGDINLDKLKGNLMVTKKKGKKKGKKKLEQQQEPCKIFLKRAGKCKNVV